MVKLSELNEVNHYNGLSKEKEQEIIREKKRIMDLVPDKITEDEDKAMDTKLPLAVHLRHKGLVNALNHLKGIILADITPKYFYELSRFKDISNGKKPDNVKYIAHQLSLAISAYNDGYSHRDGIYTAMRSDVESFYNDNPGLIKSIPLEVIKAYGLDKFETFVREYYTYQLNEDKDYALIHTQDGYGFYDGGRIGKSRSSKKRTKSAKRKSATKRLRRHRRRTFRK